MSIDTLLEAARYLEWQAQQQQIAREQEEHEQKVWSVESRCLEVVTSVPQPLRANNDASGGDHQQPQPSPAPPQTSFPLAKAHIAVIPMVPVVAAVASAPLPLPLSTAVASAATNGSVPIKAESPPIKTECLPSHPLPHHNLLCAPHIKLEPSPLLIGGNHSQFQPQVQIPYAASVSNADSQHAHLSLQASPSSQSRANGMTVDDIRGLDGKRRPGGAGTREVHNKLEKNRRAHLKECFETLKKNVPNVDEKKTSNLSVLRSALRYIQTLKRKEKEYEHEVERLAREKISMQQRLSQLKSDLSQCMDVVEIDRVLRQTSQPEDDQVSTSTASEGEENLDQGMDEGVPAPRPPATSLPKAPPAIFQAQPVLTPHLSLQHTILTSSGAPHPPPQAIAPHPAPTVIAHAAVSHPSVIQAVSHGPSANHKHLAHIAPSPGPVSSSSSAAVVQPMTVPQPIGHITVHPVAHLGAALPALYPQGVSVSQATVVGHITHSFGQRALPHAGAQVNGAVLGQAGLGKPTAVLAPHPQLVGQTAVLNPVTMVTVPPFPISTLKLA